MHSNREPHFVQKPLLLGMILFTEILLPTNLAFVHRPELLTHSYDKCIQVGDAH